MRKGICKVCLLIDDDRRKKNVYYCDTCSAWICLECEPNWYRRGLAAIKEQLIKLKTK